MLQYTVKLVYKDHPRDQRNVVLIHRWSLYEGLIAWKVYTMGPVKCGLYKQVVFIYRWSLEQVLLYSMGRQLYHASLHASFYKTHVSACATYQIYMYMQSYVPRN